MLMTVLISVLTILVFFFEPLQIDGPWVQHSKTIDTSLLPFVSPPSLHNILPASRSTPRMFYLKKVRKNISQSLRHTFFLLSKHPRNCHTHRDFSAPAPDISSFAFLHLQISLDG